MTPVRRQCIAGLAALIAVPSVLAAPVRRSRTEVPPGYTLVALEAGVPPALLYGVALQESVMSFGDAGDRRPLPWPWTLNIDGTPARFATRAAAEERLYQSLRQGVDSVDIGAMGINWRYHHARLVSVARALDPYWNLRVGASLLAAHFDATGDWVSAVGRYHAPVKRERAATYASQVFQRLRRLGHA